MHPILQQVAQLGLIPFIHVGLKPYESLTKLEVLAEEFPQITFVALAAMAREEDAEQALEMAKRRKNVLFDTGPVIYARERGVEGLIRRIGSDRLMLGSDLYALRPSYRKATTTLDIIKNSQITAQDRKNILSGNALKLFHLDSNS
jgi:predicted TIM-barrel fold metal-dependent hydrolase